MENDRHLEPRTARLVLFPPGSDPARRRRRTIFASVYLVAAVMVTWPVYSLFSGTFPLVFGLPLSLVWILLALTVVFCGVLWLYRSDRDGDREGS